MRPVHTEETPTLLSTQKLNQHLNGFLQNLPDKETTVKMMHESYFKFIGNKNLKAAPSQAYKS